MQNFNKSLVLIYVNNFQHEEFKKEKKEAIHNKEN